MTPESAVVGPAPSGLLALSELLDRAAICGAEQVWTWRRVHQAALGLAPKLGRASAVCILCNSRLNFLVAWLAALRHGVRVILPPSGGHADLAGVLHSTPHPVVVADDPADCQKNWYAGAECLILTPNAAVPAPAADLPWQPDWDRTAVLLHTSGSTGVPMPHAKTLRQLCTGAWALGDWLGRELDGGLGAVGRIVCSVPPQHMFGMEASVMLSLVHGIAVDAARPLLPADVQQTFAEAPATAWVATPIHLQTLVRSGTELPNCNLVLTSTMSLSQELARRTEALAGAPVLEIYGSTETGVLAMRRTARDANWRPVRGTRIDRASDAVLAYGEHFDSPVRLPDEIDLEPDGTFRLLGRAADMIKIGGRRASLAGLNLLLADLPGLEDGVFHLPVAAHGTDRLCLIYSGPALERGEAERWLRSRLDPAFLPRAFIRVDRLPRNDNGKLPRLALEEIFARWQRGAEPRAGQRMISAQRTFSFNFTVDGAHPALPGHFPGRPVVPGVLLLAQVLAGAGSELHRAVSAVKQVKFMASLLPNELACVDCEVCGDELRFAVRTARADRRVELAGGTLTLWSGPA